MTAQHVLLLSLMDFSKSKQIVIAFGFSASRGGKNTFSLGTVLVCAGKRFIHKVNSRRNNSCDMETVALSLNGKHQQNKTSAPFMHSFFFQILAIKAVCRCALRRETVCLRISFLCL